MAIFILGIFFFCSFGSVSVDIILLCISALKQRWIRLLCKTSRRGAVVARFLSLSTHVSSLVSSSCLPTYPLFSGDFKTTIDVLFFFVACACRFFSEWARHVLGICLVGSENLFGRKWKLVVVCFPFVCLVYLFTKYRIKMYFYSFTPQGGWIERGEIEPRKTTHAESNNPGFFHLSLFFFYKIGIALSYFC